MSLHACNEIKINNRQNTQGEIDKKTQVKHKHIPYACLSRVVQEFASFG